MKVQNIIKLFVNMTDRRVDHFKRQNDPFSPYKVICHKFCRTKFVPELNCDNNLFLKNWILQSQAGKTNLSIHFKSSIEKLKQ